MARFQKGAVVVRKSDGRKGIVITPDAPGWQPIVRWDDNKSAWEDRFADPDDLEVVKDKR